MELKSQPDANGNIWNQSVSDPNTKHDYRALVLREIFWRLCMRIFGRDKYGRQAYNHAKRHIASMKIFMKKGGIKEYDTRFKELDSYLPYCPWQAGLKQGLVPTTLSEN